MMQVAHYVGLSSIAGAGLFAGEAIPVGAVIYRDDPRFMIILEDADLDAMPAPVRAAFLKYCYRGRGQHRLVGRWYYCTDDARFFNHADAPNAIWDETRDVYVAARAIAAGEELTCDYRSFSEDGDYDFLSARAEVSSGAGG